MPAFRGAKRDTNAAPLFTICPLPDSLLATCDVIRDGLLNVYKPVGFTSRDVVDRVSRALRQKRCGHAGTLDPLAEGVVVVCCGQATRLVPRVQDTTKLYRAEFVLGCRSDTDDICGNVRSFWSDDAEPLVWSAVRTHRESIRARIEEFVPPAIPEGIVWPDEATVRSALAGFEGDVEQVPPVYSAVKIEGRRAYHLARTGRPVELTARVVRIDRATLIDYAPPRLTVEIECGSGTYVRSVGRDLGDRLGVGAVMSRLLRSGVGPFTRETAVPLDTVHKSTISEHLLPLQAAVPDLSTWPCDAVAENEILHGRVIVRPFPADDAPDDATEFALLTPSGRLLSVARYDATAACLRPVLVFPPTDSSAE